MVRIVSIVSAKGGVGKSTLVANLGTALATHYKKKVAVVDCNLTNPHLGLYLGTLSSWPVNLNSVLRNKAKLKDAMHKTAHGVHVVPASFEVKHAHKGTGKLREQMRKAFAEMDIVLLDAAPGMGADALLPLKLSDDVFFVSTPHIPSIVDITKVLHLLKSTDAKPSGIVLNRVRKQRYELSEAEISQFTYLPIVARIPEDESVLKSANFKVPVVVMSPRAPASAALSALAGHIVGEQAAPAKRGFLGFLRFRR